MNDSQIQSLLIEETLRLKNDLVLIASENYPSPDVLKLCGSIFSTKYSEGYPGKRYYEGCDTVDKVENLAIQRAKELFGCDHVNVQPHSGTQANMAVYLSVLEQNDSILSMRLDQGGHLSHGSKVNFSGKNYNAYFYGVDKNTEIIDYDEVEKLANQIKPKLIVCGASAYSRIIDFKKFSEIAKSVGAFLLSDVAHISGLIAADQHPSPIHDSDFVTSTTHKTLRGPRGAIIMCKDKHKSIIDKAVFPGMQGGPFMNMIAARAVAFKEAKSDEFKNYIKNVILNSKKLSEVLIDHNLRVVSGGTDNHQFTVDLTSNKTTGEEIAKTLLQVGIVVNKNGIPNDPLPPRITSGIRIGTPALTSRGMGLEEMESIGNYICEAIFNRGNSAKLQSLRGKVTELTSRFSFPGYQEFEK